jgi:solute:Na+ symporter, SSS family
MFEWFEYIIVGVYVLVILGIGVYFSRKGSANVDEYFLGGQSLPWWVLGISFMTSNLDLTGTMVIASFFSMVGLKGFLVELRGGTCLPVAVFMVFMAKWHRRAGVMTVSEWMEFRFGDDAGSRAARLVSAIGVVILVLGMSTYFCVGFGKFLGLYFPFVEDPELNATICSVIFTSIATLHILYSGLYGVAFTDVLQGVMILFTVTAISYLAFTMDTDPATLGAAWQRLGAEGMTWQQWTSMTPSWTMTFPKGYEGYNAFGTLLSFWTLRIFLEGFGGPLIPYATQRFFAAKDDRDASLTTGISLVLFVIRWPLIIGVAVLGLGLGANIPSDPEMVFPTVVATYFPAGLRAVIVSCLIAAAMSTFDSTVNAGGAYIVNDIYRRFINPKASDKGLMRLSMVATVGITVVCLLLSSTITSINQIWSWISMGFFGGLVVPMILRWYWARFNGWGYTVGSLVGMVTAMAQGLFLSGWPEYYQLGVISTVSLVASVVATYATAPSPPEAVTAFYKKTRPLGFWNVARAQLDPGEVASIRSENRWDVASCFVALAGFYFFFLSPMFLIIHQYSTAGSYLAGALGCAAVLYFTWYKRL